MKRLSIRTPSPAHPWVRDPSRRRTLVAAALAAGIAVASADAAMAGASDPQAGASDPQAGACSATCRDALPRVVTNGQARIRLAPDVAYLTIAAEAREPTPKAALEKNARAMQAVQQKLGDAGVPREAIRTLAYELRQEFDFASGKQTPRGYFSRNAIEVRVDDVARVGELIDLGVGAGASAVADIRFDLKDRDGVERRALELAVADARARADAAARGAGRKVAAVILVEEQGDSTPQPRMLARAMVAEAAAAPPTSIAPGEISVEARANLTALLD